ncbi:hypothetical protein NXJ61_002854 [Salmonella enterica subsp. enterica serovar Elomrane]|uniref:Uncharacterized protein n=2 Tax=Salmonella enterica TaxID=28901 RepID=A0A749T8F5_SALER|nr:hypothetical protein [Salmonella enterica]ECJ5703805.1 hypothetical protein [Salmonella enterica subsp. enterica]QVB09617.1 hypothetical protein JYM76_18205 [Salmonella enterica subsp. enterica serovar Javiana]EAW5838390.1 hypothetical protein [Salmonella enterica]EAW9545247.1 hypothetical protein [Salmonella enterica]EAW9608126.1 hypothetical protein [Salmonella enterica]
MNFLCAGRAQSLKIAAPHPVIALPARCPSGVFSEIINTLPRRCLLVFQTLPYHPGRCHEIVGRMVVVFALSAFSAAALADETPAEAIARLYSPLADNSNEILSTGFIVDLRSLKSFKKRNSYT